MQEKFTEKIEGHDLIIAIATMLSRENEDIIDTLKKEEAKGAKRVYLSVMEDESLSDSSDMFIRYEAGSEEGVLLLVADALVKKEQLSEPLKEYFDEMDEGYICAETNIAEEEIEAIGHMYQRAKNPLLLLGKEFFSHPRAANIAALIKTIAKYANIELLCLGEFDENKSFDTPDEIAQLESFDGTNVFTCKAKKSDEKSMLIGSKQFAVAAKLQDQEAVHVDILGTEDDRVFVLDPSLKGTIALMPGAHSESAYQIQKAKITKREVQ